MVKLLPLIVCVITRAVLAGPGLFDMGTAQSAVWGGFTRVTPGSLFSDKSGFGWQSGEGLKAQARAHAGLVENRSRGTQEPPPIWTNPIHEGAIRQPPPRR